MQKSVAIIGAVALVAIVGTLCAFNTESTEFRLQGSMEKTWASWKAQNNKTYGGPEDKARFAVFQMNYKIIQAHNAKKSNHTLGLNKFADLTRKEFAALYTGASTAFKRAANDCAAPSETSKKIAAPETLDWRTQGRVGAVKNQASCGSCWAFSSTGSLEGLAAKKGGEIPSFSEQQLVDCTTGTWGNFGCGGGWVQNSFHYTIKNGIALETDYKYTAVDGKCQDSTVKSAFTHTGCANVAIQDPQALIEALQTGPVSVYVQADTSDFQFYTGGVVTGTNCFNEGQIDHAVLAVGYTQKSWIVKNSWGSGWGDKGYIQLDISNSADKNGVCGILSTPNVYPLL